MSLTTFLLADAVSKGGPGSGPHPGDMTPGKINGELDRLDNKSRENNAKLIEAGFGSLRPSEFPKDHPLVQEYHAIQDRKGALHQEIANRYGPSAPNRLPKGFGPIKGRK